MKSKVEIATLFKEGRRFHVAHCVALWLPDEQFRYGVFLSRKHGKAHDRNKIKRLYREAIRLTRRELTASGKLAILPRAGLPIDSAGEIKTDVSKLIEQINRTC